MERISFSVVIPLYNKEKSILSTIQSVLNQTYNDYEIVIVNDGSKDNSLNVVKSIINDKIRIIDKPNGGVSSARNRGIMEARNNYIAFLDSDDLWADCHLATLAKMIKKYPEDIMFYTKYGSVEQVKFNDNIDIQRTDNYLCEFFKNNRAWTGTVCFRKNNLIKQNLLFNEKLTHGEDVDLWYRVSLKYGAVFCNKYTAIYRQNTENQATAFLPKDLTKHYYFIMNPIDFSNVVRGMDYYYYHQQILVNYVFSTRQFNLLLPIAKKQGFFNCFLYCCRCISQFIYNKITK